MDNCTLWLASLIHPCAMIQSPYCPGASAHGCSQLKHQILRVSSYMHWKKVALTQGGSPQLQKLGLNCLPLLPWCRVTVFATHCSNKAWILVWRYIITAQTLAHCAWIFFKVQLSTHEYSLSYTHFWQKYAFLKFICKASIHCVLETSRWATAWAWMNLDCNWHFLG